MGTNPNSKILTVVGRNYQNFGESFLSLQKSSIEWLHLIYIGPDGFCTKSELLGIGSESQVPLQRDHFLSYLKNHIPFGFAMLHNHPNGTPPSKQDGVFNAFLRDLSKQTNRKFLNHCVVSKKLHYMRGMQDNVFNEL